jgi:4-alpha-glucanotransferase
MNIGAALTKASFSEEERGAGVLLHVTSLPSAYGIGDIGPGALAWVDCLHEAGQTWWQALPLGPTGYGNSPYQCLSSFAGNGLLASPEWLMEDGLLASQDCAGLSFTAGVIEYERVIPFKHRLLDIAWSNFNSGRHSALRCLFEQFSMEQAHWLDDYALFRALKETHQGAYFVDWPTQLVQRDSAALADARRRLHDLIDKVRFAQFLLFRQGECLKAHARARGVRLIGDLPFFVSPDSSDVWAHPELFLLDKSLRPSFVAGVPPDGFSADGQLWGNPVYNWEALRQSGYRWFIDRLRALLAHVNVIRLDHFRGFAAAWHVPAGAASAKSGHWVNGPGADLFNQIRSDLGALPFIAEDLGLITPDVDALRVQFGLPGTRVLQFAFDGRGDNPHLPANYTTNTVAYTGTHDNPTSRGWFEGLSAHEQKRIWDSLERPAGQTSEIAWELIDRAWSSRAAVAIAPLQDLLNLGPEGRMNMPGSTQGNWRWRCLDGLLSTCILGRLRDLTEKAGRLPLRQSQTRCQSA